MDIYETVWRSAVVVKISLRRGSEVEFAIYVFVLSEIFLFSSLKKGSYIDLFVH